jgi:hypothetical protein
MKNCVFLSSLLFLVHHHHAFFPPRQNNPSKKLNATTPPTTFTPPECMHIRHSPPSPENPIFLPKNIHSTNCQRTFQRERKNPSTIQNTPSIPPRRKDCRFQPQEDRQTKGKEERGFGTSGKRRLVFLLIINCFFAFVYILCFFSSCAPCTLLLCSVPLASTRIPVCTGETRLEGRASAAMAWHGVDPDLGPID